MFCPTLIWPARLPLGEVPVKIGKHPGVARGQNENRLRLLRVYAGIVSPNPSRALWADSKAYRLNLAFSH